MRAILTAAVGILGLTSAAMAADMPRKAALAPLPPPALWTGFYVGGNVGASWGQIDTSNASVTTNGLLTSGVVGLQAGTFAGPDRSLDSKGSFIGGIQFGYNYEFVNHVVLGLEGDFNWTRNKANDSFAASVQGPTYSGETKADWIATARGRLGYSFGAFLPYVTGGAAFAHLNSSLTIAPWTTLGGAAPSPLDPQFGASTSKTLTGYAVGVGFEYAIARNWSVKAEYLHLGFGNQGTDWNFGAPGTAHVDAKLSFDLARVGVNYRF